MRQLVQVGSGVVTRVNGSDHFTLLLGSGRMANLPLVLPDYALYNKRCISWILSMVYCPAQAYAIISCPERKYNIYLYGNNFYMQN